ncbi:unnamed protein product [Cylicocyclus nassatus]|uniref:Uncharacterized protein n=1 Tax=Cylicocyclus nassatus TaxID=53992 RepID=A0AA36H5L6_CYLNA|nr:unnamed protein product [Cylicocyclus nassatus]
MENTDLASTNTMFDIGVRQLDFVESSTSIENCNEMDEIARSTTTIMLSIERSVATKFLHQYFNNRIVGPLLICAQIVVSAVLLTFVYIPVQLDGVVTYYCMAMSCSKPLFTVVPLSISMIIQSIGIIIFTRLKGVNKEIKMKLRTTGDLRARYQVEETLRSLNTLSPFFYSSYAFIFTYLALMCLTMTIGTKFSEPIFLAVIEGTNWMPQFCMFLPFLLWYRSKNFTNKIRSLLTTEIATTTERYDEELRKMWL